MRGRLFAWAHLVAAAMATAACGAVTFTTTHGLGAHDLDGMMSSSDLIHGLIATELSGDKGWHPANTNPADRLPAFTDGVGVLSSNLTGLLNDFPGAGAPAKLIQYDLGGTFDISGINIFSGNKNDADGRVFSTTVIRYSTNNGGSFSTLGYFQSDPSGSINNEDLFGSEPFITENRVTQVSIFDDAAAALLSGVTNLQFDFYATNNTQGQMRDAWGSTTDAVSAADPTNPDNINPFTGVSDGLTGAISSPLIWEIDVLGQAAAVANANFNGDGAVDGRDFLIWQGGFGKTGNAVLADGDANSDSNVDGSDLAVWRGQFGTTGLVTAVPEPGVSALAVGSILALTTRRKRRCGRVGELLPRNHPHFIS